MKLEIVEMRKEKVLFRDLNTGILRVRKLYGSYGIMHFTYKKQRILLFEFVPQRDGTLLYFREC